MTGRRQSTIPQWAERERLSDMTWIGENMHVFWPAAQQQHRERGRGAIVVDTTQKPIPNAGHPFSYLIEEQLRALEEHDAVRMVQTYDPTKEVVIMLLKGDRSSTYRMMLLQPE